MNDTMYSNEIPNRMLYDLMIDMKQDIDRRLERLELKVEKNSEKIEELFLRGDKVKIGFSRTFLAGNSILAGFIAFIVAMFTGQYVMRLK